jgi:hypothetical protein
LIKETRKKTRETTSPQVETWKEAVTNGALF